MKQLLYIFLLLVSTIVFCSDIPNILNVLALLDFNNTLCELLPTVVPIYDRSDFLPGPVPGFPPLEMLFLQQLYNTTNGDNWIWRENGTRWDFSPGANPCVDHWQGLNCTLLPNEDYFYISQIELPCYGLRGSIPASIAELHGLEVLLLANNELSGMIPSAIGELSFLGALVLLDNSINGTLPPQLGNLANLEILSVAFNFINGTIPATLGNLSQLRMLDAADNNLRGRIPPFLGSLLELEYMELALNELSGPIPASLGLIPNLLVLALGSNKLTGRILLLPGDFSNLQLFSVEINDFTGPIPSGIGQLNQLEIVNLGSNKLTGSIPPEMGNLVKLFGLGMNNCSLNGTIPSELGKLTDIRILALDINHITGTIPASLGNCTKMKDFGFGDNRLEGPIPASFANFLNLRQFIGSINLLTGTIPQFFSSFDKLQILDLNNNSLHGTIPSDLGRMTNLNEIGLRMNKMTGTIPSSMGNLTLLQMVDLDSNTFNGTIPSSLGELPNLSYIYLFNNSLTGTIPESIGDIGSLQCLDVNTNMLTGPIPKSFANLSQLQTLVLNSNQLTGSLDSVFDPNSTNLVSIQVNGNQLTGSLPSELFLLPNLTTFVASKNCFLGTLPDSVCALNNMQTFVLNGLSSSKACRKEFFKGQRAYTLKDVVRGTIPTCLYALPQINTLHLSGNGFTGSLPRDMNISSTLFDLTLSHNQLTSTVPPQVQQRVWYNLDLSYNRLSGTLRTDFATVDVAGSPAEMILPNRSVFLDNNRFSGKIPGAMQHFVNISILGTNLFTCDLDQRDLPQQDPGKSKYQCGSAGFDTLYYFWMGLVCLFFAVLVLMSANAWQVGPFTAQALRQWLALVEERDARTPAFADYLTALHGFGRMAVLVTAFSVLVLLPLYAALSSSYNTLTYQYAWTVSSTYMSGSVPVATELPLWTLLLCLVLGVMDHCLRLLKSPTFQTGAREFIMFPTRRNAFGQLTYVVINTCVVVSANMLYVYIAIYQSTTLLFFARVMLSFFKVGWNSFLTSYLLEWTVPSKTSRSADSHFFTMQVLVALLNNIVIPCLVIACISPNCYYNVFYPAPAVNLQYVYSECEVIFLVTDQCIGSATTERSSSYDPPFKYDYQCSSSFITYYAPAFVNLCIVSTFITPVMQMAMHRLYLRAVPGTRWHELLDYLLPRNLKPLPAAADQEHHHHSGTLLQGSQVLMVMVVYVGLLLTFGVMFPPLAVALLVTLFASAYFAKLKVGCFMAAAQEAGRLPEVLAIIEHECRGIKAAAVLYKSAWLLCIVSCWFYTLFLFDTLGDAVGFGKAYWVLIVMPLMPAMLYAVYKIYTFMHPVGTRAVPNSSAASVEAELEMNNSFDTAEKQEEIFNVLLS